jgi:hypothetical protein
MGQLEVIEAEPLGEDIVEKLEAVLSKAKKGELSSVAIAVVYRDGSTGGSWSKAPSSSLQIGSVTMLQWRLARKLAE